MALVRADRLPLPFLGPLIDSPLDEILVRAALDLGKPLSFTITWVTLAQASATCILNKALPTRDGWNKFQE